MDEDFESRWSEAVEAGQRNLRVVTLLKNWCFHAEVVRTRGRGMIEAVTGLPIGHMGVQCKFSTENSTYCWQLEDAAYEFYQRCCKGCRVRAPVGIPNILSFVDPRERAEEARKRARNEKDAEENRKQHERREERATLRFELSLEETFVFDLLDELDQEGVAVDDPRLEQLANLAPETFTRKVIEHLLPAVLHQQLPYSLPAARALIRAALEPNEKFLIAVRLISKYEKSPDVIDVVLRDAERLSGEDLRIVLRRFVSMALGPPPGFHFGDPTALNPVPIRELFQKRDLEIRAEVCVLLSDENPRKVSAAAEIMLAIGNDELLRNHSNTIFTKLLRRRILLPVERGDGRVLYYLREVAAESFKRFPEEVDGIIQSFLADGDDVGREEAQRTYSSALSRRRQQSMDVGKAERIAFKRLLWAAVERPENAMTQAAQFFRHPWDDFAQLAIDHFDDLIGAAATLSEKYAQVDARYSLDIAENGLADIEKGNRRAAIDGLQASLIEWAAVGAKSKGAAGIEQFLDLYRRLPEGQVQMRGNMITHVSKLLIGVESLNLILSDWYRALMDESAVVRAGAIKAWEDVPYDLVKNFPDLFFEAFSVLLNDPYVIVHQSAVQALRHRSFPEEKRGLVKPGLWNLISYYSQQHKQENFLIECIDAFALLCIPLNKRKGKVAQLLMGILLRLEGSVLYKAVDRLHYSFAEVPGFARVALKAIQDNYTRSISIDDCASAILKASQNELQSCVEEIRKAFKKLIPFSPGDFAEALLYTAALVRAGAPSAACSCLKDLLASIPVDERHKHWRLEVALVEVASECECAIVDGKPVVDISLRWSSLLSDLEQENEARTKFRNFPPDFFLSN